MNDDKQLVQGVSDSAGDSDENTLEPRNTGENHKALVSLPSMQILYLYLKFFLDLK